MPEYWHGFSSLSGAEGPMSCTIRMTKE